MPSQGCLYMLRTLPEGIFVPEPNFTQQGKTKPAHLQYVHLSQRFKNQPFPMWVQSKVVQTWRDKNFHISLLSQVILLKLSVQKEVENSLPLSFYLHSTQGQGSSFWQGLWMVAVKQQENENVSSTISGVIFYKIIIKWDSTQRESADRFVSQK